MAAINPHLNFNGNREEASSFYKSVFGDEFITLQRFRDTPEADKLPASNLDKIMHIALPIGNGNLRTATDALESAGQTLTLGNNIHLSVSTNSDAETKKIFDALSAGGKITVPWIRCFGILILRMCTDKFGV